MAIPNAEHGFQYKRETRLQNPGINVQIHLVSCFCKP